MYVCIYIGPSLHCTYTYAILDFLFAQVCFITTALLSFLFY